MRSSRSIWELPRTTPASAFTIFLVQFSAAAGYQISYAVYVSDYSRYLPADTPAKGVIGWTYLGAAASTIWLMSLGALIGGSLSIDVSGDAMYTVDGTTFVSAFQSRQQAYRVVTANDLALRRPAFFTVMEGVRP